jgi:competence protein ComEC
MARKMRKKTKRKINKAIFSIIMVIILAIAGYFFKDELPGGFLNNDATVGGSVDGVPAITDPNYLTVHYIDVGQGDSIFLACGGEYMLIDAGENDDEDRAVRYLKNLGIDRIDLVVATHAHSDHIGEMDDVLNAIPATEIWYPDYRHGTKTEQRFLTAASNCGANLYEPELGETYDLGGATVTVLGPVKEYDDPNDMSIIVLVEFGDDRFLFTGDMENEDAAENDLVAYWGDEALRADVLKVGHHGSNTSTSYHFLRAVSPAYAVISVGEGNEYGHPKPQTMDILGQAEVYVYRTDEMGDIVAISDGENIAFSWVRTENLPYIPPAKSE